jgi:hypothetical protein
MRYGTHSTRPQRTFEQNCPAGRPMRPHLPPGTQLVNGPGPTSDAAADGSGRRGRARLGALA